ncbi:hypothetical protein AK830_g6899 [Neonectria ditissima]|uniref:Uncharacterized protein n=1 Tax=Neonectria ditissima TaxID=78410 RepID=A0A0P7BBB7_9HYPO|nr:hypothetical protein AK830_g6899 [Neonectria ditissima]
MPYLFESHEWRLIQALGQLFDPRKAQYHVQLGPLSNHKQAHPTAELIEVELRQTFMAKKSDRDLDSTEFEKCQAKLASLCLLLDGLVSVRTGHGGSEGQAYSRLQSLAAFMESTSEPLDLVSGLDTTLFALPHGPDKLHDCLRVVTECNDTLSRLLAAPTQEPAVRLSENKKRASKKARIRNRVTPILETLFEHFSCKTPHKVLLKLIEDPDEDLLLPSLQLMLPRCPDLEMWQEARCNSINFVETSPSLINDICTNLRNQTDQGKALVLDFVNYKLFGAWAGFTSFGAGLLTKESLSQLIVKGAFKPISRDINALLRGASTSQFSTKDKRALAVKLGFCLMDFFDTELTSETIYFLDPSASSANREFPYLAFSSKLPPVISSGNIRIGHPTLLSFAKLLLEMEYGQVIELDISTDNNQNQLAWVKLMGIVDDLEEDKSDLYLQAIRGCLLVPPMLAKILSSRGTERKDTAPRIRKKLYKEVVRNLELGLAESIPRSAHKRRRSESPPPSDRRDKAQAAVPLRTSKWSESEQTTPGYKRRRVPEPQQQSLPAVSSLFIRETNGLIGDNFGSGHEAGPQLLENEAVSGNCPPVNRDAFEIAIVCALPLEYNAVSLLVDHYWDKDGDIYGRAVGDANTYTTGRIGKFDVVLVLLSNMGKVSAANSAAGLRLSYPKVRLVLLTGVCGGVPNLGTDEELLLGDVVISETIVQYDYGRHFPDGFAMKGTVEDVLGRPTKNIRNLVSILRTDRAQEQLKQRAAFFLQRLQEKLFEASFRHKHYTALDCQCMNCHSSSDPVCDESRKLSCDELGCDVTNIVLRERLKLKRQLENEGRSKDAQAPSIFVGRIGSGDKVLKSGEDRDRIAKQHDLLAFGMEGAGVWDEIPCIVTKGVCDYADSHKSKSWQAFAAATAASVTKALLERYIQTDS